MSMPHAVAAELCRHRSDAPWAPNTITKGEIMRDLNKTYLKTRSINFEKLKSFGFKDSKNEYLFKKEIMKGDFIVIIKVDKKSAISKVLDSFDETEYSLVDVEESSGPFVGKIKEEYEKILESFVLKCTYVDTFKEKSSKKVCEYIKDKYDGELEYLWDDYDGAVFRNKENLKWYGVMMKIKVKSFVTSTLKRLKLSGKTTDFELLNKSDIDDDALMEVIDLHIDKEKSQELIDYKKIFPGYHMNKDSWITIILDKNTDLKMLYNLIDASYQMTVKSGYYIVPSNIDRFDVIRYVEQNKTFVWYKQPKDVKPGDIVFVYVGAPYSQIMYKCEVVRANLRIYSERDMELKLIKKFKDGEYPYSFLKEQGASFIRTPRSLPERVAKLIK